MAWLAWLKNIPSILGSLVGLSGSEKAEEIRAQVELEEARALQRGHLAPRYYGGFIKWTLIAVGGIIAIIGLFFPEVVDLNNAMDVLKQVLGFAVGIE